jgi:translation initiation factor IF-2
VLRADVQGSAEALKESLEALSTEKVRVEVIFTGVGAINENDVKFASAGEAVIIGFNSKPVGKAATQADSVGVEVLQFSIIYEATERVTELMIDQLDPVFKENDIGEAEVRQIFSIPKLGVVAGCRVLRGRVTRASHVRVKRGGEVVYEGEVESLRSFKDDVKEVGEGHECGIVIANFPGVEAEDIIEAYELEKLRATL